jgi:Ca2+-binding RTX toxin-like protein
MLIKGTIGDDSFEKSLQDLEGDDTLKGLAGEDWFRMLVGGKDTVDGGEGEGDVAFYSDYTTKLTINLRDGFVTDTLGNTDTLIGIEAAHAGTAGDDITMGDNGGYVFARAGNDTIRTGKNGNFVVVGSGNDKVIGNVGFDTVDFGGDVKSSGFDGDGGGFITHGATVNLQTGKATDGWGDTDTLTGVEGIQGTVFADKITGDKGGNDLKGGDGDDTIDGGGVPLLASGEQSYEETDNLFGEGGDDKITLTAAGYADGGNGDDEITIVGEGTANGGAGDDRIFGKTRGHNGDFDYAGLGFYGATEGIVANFTTKKYAGVAGGSNAKGYAISDGQGGTDKAFGVHGLDDTKFGDSIFLDGSLKNSYGNSFTVNLSAGNDYVRIIGMKEAAINYDGANGAVSIDLEAGEATDVDEENNFIGYDRIVGEVAHARGTRFNDSIAGAGNDESIRGRLGSDMIWGRGGDDKLWGDEKSDRQGDGNDTINGGAGNDWMRGGGGKDRFVFDAKLSEKTNIDTIEDFNVKDDTLILDNAIFAVGKAGKFDAALFADAKSEIGGKTRIIYDTKSGDLSYDADGSGKKFEAVQFATLDNHAKLTAADFAVV